MDSPPVFCINCSHLLGNRNRIELVEDWRCWHSNNIQSRTHNLVTGTPITNYVVSNISDVRTRLCLGDWYEEYVRPTYQAPPVEIGKMVDVTAKLSSLKKSLKNITTNDL